jgi:hypothetical protein
VSESAATPFDGFLARVDEVEGGLRRAAAAGAPQGLTAPDEPSGEQWEAGQVWAHLAEFVPYWIGEARSVLTAESDQPVPFGRVKTDPGRIAAIAATCGRSCAKWTATRRTGHEWAFIPSSVR